MSRATPKMRDFAERLIAYESRGYKTSGNKTVAAFRACEKLRPHLATLLGSTGFHALLSRALALARAEAPRLCAVQVKADGSLAAADAPETPLDANEPVEGGVVLLALLLGLLVAFIGENLTQRLLRDVWPKLTVSE